MYKRQYIFTYVLICLIYAFPPKKKAPRSFYYYIPLLNMAPGMQWKQECYTK